jgi:hypothetical protein
MIAIDSKNVFSDLPELVDQAHTALILVDMERDFIEPERVFGALGIDLSMYAESWPPLAALRAAVARRWSYIFRTQRCPSEWAILHRIFDLICGCMVRRVVMARTCVTRSPILRDTHSPRSSRHSRMNS